MTRKSTGCLSFVLTCLLIASGCAQAPQKPAPAEPAAQPQAQPTSVPSVVPSPLPTVVPTVLPEPAATVAPSPTPSPSAIQSAKTTSTNPIAFKMGGAIYLALENWSRIGLSGDSKMGFGFAGELGIGIQIDDMKALVGPHLGLHRWSASRTNNSQSATSSVYVEMADAGLVFMFYFDDLYIKAGMGSATISSGMIVSGKDIKYAYDGDEYSYHSVGLGAEMDHWLFGLTAVNYRGYASLANRVEFQIGYGF